MVTSVTGTSVTLSWMTPSPSTGVITQYDLQYRICASGGRTTLLSLSSTFTVTGLAINTEYCFRVRAYTVLSLGASPYTNEIRGRTCKLHVI